MSGAIVVEDLAYSYRRASEPAVDGISFAVEDGEIFGLLGPNGAGKTTTVRMLATILQPARGRALIAGKDAARDPLGTRRAFAAVLQETAVEPLLTVRDNLELCGRLRGLDAAARRAAEARLVALLELESHLGKLGQDLSAGTKRRVQVAKALMAPAPVLFLDEATTGMDPLVKRRVIEALRAEAREGRTILLTTQLLDEAESLCARMALVKGGKVAALGTLPELRARAHARPLLRIAIALARADAAAHDEIAAWPCLNRREAGGGFALTVAGDENEWIRRVADLASRHPLSRFELSAADLEDVFIEVYGGSAARPSGEAREEA